MTKFSDWSFTTDERRGNVFISEDETKILLMDDEALVATVEMDNGSFSVKMHCPGKVVIIPEEKQVKVTL